MKLHELKPRPGAKHRTKRLGCGESSGRGKTSGRGHKGQRARSNGGIRIGFEGGQMPLIRRLPKRGFNNKNFATVLAPLNVDRLDVFNDGDTVDAEAIFAKRLVTGNWDGIKLLGRGEIKKKLTIKVDAASKSAIEKVEKAGGKVEINTPTEDSKPADKE